MYGKVCCQLTGSSDFTLKLLLPVNWQQRFYDEMVTFNLTGSSDFNVNSLLPIKLKVDYMSPFNAMCVLYSGRAVTDVEKKLVAQPLA